MRLVVARVVALRGERKKRGERTIRQGFHSPWPPKKLPRMCFATGSSLYRRMLT